ncbi:Fc.00g101750.m01.CDS01 [Cosmosporella sp. VM-42]
MSPASLASLPLEITDAIFSRLGPEALLNVRCLSHRLESVATARAFRSVSIYTEIGREEPESSYFKKFTQTAQSKRLRGLVREAECVVSLFPPADWEHKLPTDFLNVLPLLRYFRNLDTLHVSLYRNFVLKEQVADFEYRVLDTIFQCLAGTWSPGRQKLMDSTLALSFDAQYYQDEGASLSPVAAPVRLRKFSVSGAGDYYEPRLMESEVFNAIIQPNCLVDMALGTDQSFQEDQGESVMTYRMFGNLSRSWLPANLAENLRVLMLSYDAGGDWWCSKPNLQTIKLPRLKVLGLGSFVFCSQWQVDWVASLGKGNVGGLEEIHLNACSVLYQVINKEPLDEDASSSFGSLRWYMILTLWCASIPGLKVFQMEEETWMPDTWYNRLDSVSLMAGSIKLVYVILDEGVFTNVVNVFYDTPPFGDDSDDSDDDSDDETRRHFFQLEENCEDRDKAALGRLMAMIETNLD